MGEDRRRRKLHKEQHDYVDQLRSYHSRGVSIFIDEKIVLQEKDWYKIFQVREDGAVYMADYVKSDQGKLSAIYFDLVYLDYDARLAWERKKRLEETVKKAQIQHYKSVLQQFRKEREQTGRGREGKNREE